MRDVSSRIVFVLLLVGCGAPAPDEAAPPDEAAWSSPTDPATIRRAFIASSQGDPGARYDVRPVSPGVLVAPSDALSAELSREGVAVRPSDAERALELRAERFGRRGHERALAPVTPTADGNRASYAREGLTEWYLAGPLGLEQGFTIDAPPSGEGELVVRVRVGASMTGTLDDDGAAITFAAGDTDRLRYSDLYAVDARGRDLPAHLAIDGDVLTLAVRDDGAVYPITIDPLVTTQQTKLTASDAAGGDSLGAAVSISGDTAIVGAYLDNTPAGNDAGSAYVYVRSGTSWSEQAHLFASDPVAGDSFGVSVAIDGDTAVVGASAKDGGAGAVYVFVRSGTTWTEQQKLVASDRAASDAFGANVAITGDTLSVGAPGDDHAGGTDAGAAYVFVRSGTAWTEQQKIVATDAAADQRFGGSTSLSGDTVAIGQLTSSGTGGDGSAYVFVRSAGVWSQQARLRGTDTATDDNFGRSVSVSGDTLAVGATRHDTAPSADQGNAYVFVRSGVIWTQQAKLSASDAGLQDFFGQSVSLVGDRLAIGSISHPVGGSAYLFTRSGTTWTEEGQLIRSDPAGSDQFGFDISMSGSTIVVGARWDDTTAGGNAGSAYVFVARSGDGDTCTLASECSSGICVDGVCCASACGGGAADCMACSVTAGGTSDGTCTALAPATAAATVCRAAGPGACDVAETCSASSTTCPADGFASASTVCRASTGLCDPAETCSGSSAACPSNALASSGTVCRPSAGLCDAVETCSGSSAACPPDGVASAGTTCRASAGPCDVAETCSGTGIGCPADGFASSGTTCRTSAGACDVAETCTGTGAACPANVFAASGTTCRASAGVCDVAETCTGLAAACPANGYVSSSTECRASAGPCDLAERCTGSAALCPSDAFASSSTTCRVSAGPCDVAELCPGSSALCPTDAYASAGTVCRAAAGACDVAESCAGGTALCPSDAVAATGTVCRAASGVCDVEETCAGSATCPIDSFAPDGTACADTLVCNGEEVCSAGACAGTALGCDDGDACTDDRCVEPGGCAHDVVTDCCVADAECDDGDACTDDACVTSRCESTPIAGCGVDGGPGPDAGTGADGGAASADASIALDAGADAGPDATMEGGCGCRTAGSPDGGAPSLLLLLGLLAGSLARRRRRTASRKHS